MTTKAPSGSAGNTDALVDLGAGRAETDVMLDDAFVETAEFKLLRDNLQYQFVIGRRGTGKSALFRRLARHYEARRHDSLVVRFVPEETSAQAFYDAVARLGLDYRKTRTITRQIWRAVLLRRAVEAVIQLDPGHADARLSRDWVGRHQVVLKLGSLADGWRLVERFRSDSEPSSIGLRIQEEFELEEIQAALCRQLKRNGRRVLFLIDRLDEGWLPDRAATASVGGLAALAAGFADSRDPIAVLLFARDNMFRALSYLDNDFSRHIKDNTLRLRWTEEQLFHLVTARLRVRLGLDAENDTRVWNHFANRELANRDGFRLCLQNTLYRPRDILGLLNHALVVAKRSARSAIIPSDVTAGAKEISDERLVDLLNEYEIVLPGLRGIVELLRGSHSMIDTGQALELLADEPGSSQSGESIRDSSTFALLNTPASRFDALYGIGLIGRFQQSTNRYVFCHDGAIGAGPSLQRPEKIATHPAYWRALDITSDTDPWDDSILLEIGDDYGEIDSSGAVRELRDLRTQQVGQTVASLNDVPEGSEGAERFHAWVARAFQIMFSNVLTVVETKSTYTTVPHRAIVASVRSDGGFWNRVVRQHQSPKVVIEAVNYPLFSESDFARLASYVSREHSRFGIAVVRRADDALTPGERALCKRYYHDAGGFVGFIVTTAMITRALRKLRSPKRIDYAEEKFGKRLDTYEGSYLSLKPRR